MLTRCLMILPIVLAACASKPKPIGKDTIDPSYTLGGGVFESGDPVIIVAAARDFGGRMVLCAARVNEIIGSKHKRSIENVLQAGRIELNGDTVVTNLRFLPLTKSGKEIAGSQADCFDTKESWTDGEKIVEIVIPPYSDRSSNQEERRFNPRRDLTWEIAPVPQAVPAQDDPDPKPGQWQRSSS